MELPGVWVRVVKEELELASQSGSHVKPVHSKRTGKLMRDIGRVFPGVDIQGPGSSGCGRPFDHLKTFFNDRSNSQPK